MSNDLGASADAETGSREPGLASRPGPAGFDPARLEFRPDHEGAFDELVATFADGGVFIETMDDQSVYVDFQWDDGLHCQLWISCGGKAKLRYFHEHDQGEPPRYTALGVDRKPWMPSYIDIPRPASGIEAGTGKTACGLDPKGDGPAPQEDAHD